MTADACLTDAPTASRAAHRPCLAPARPIDPPYDDEVTGPAVPPRTVAYPSGSPGAAAPGRVATTDTVPAELVPADLVPAELVPSPRRSTARTGHGGQFHHAPGPAAVLVVRAIVETLSGTRTPNQLTGWTTPRLQADLERRMPRGVRHTRCAIRSIRVSEPRPGVAEVSAVIVRGARAAALALRMESTDGRWRVTTLQVG